MNLEPLKRPDIKVFRKILSKCGGNLTKVSNIIGVNRSTIWSWANTYPEYKQAIRDERSKLFDECLATARTMALGLPAYENVFDDNGDPVVDKETGKQKKVFSGWIERPDGQMVRYLMSHLDRNESFGDFPTMDEGEGANQGVPIKAWIMKMNNPDE